MITWCLKSFDKLAVGELYQILQLRSAVFVVEQNCIFQDMDDKDQYASHLCAWQQHELIAYTRILPPGLSYTDASIGRFLVNISYRKSGIGTALLKRSIDAVYQQFGIVPIKIGAQLYLRKFYENFGFLVQGEVYSEDNIDHILMSLPIPQ